jgi:hypothetical protein
MESIDLGLWEADYTNVSWLADSRGLWWSSHWEDAQQSPGL